MDEKFTQYQNLLAFLIAPTVQQQINYQHQAMRAAESFN